MAREEDRPGQHPSGSEPLFPTELPPELAEFLRRSGDYSCVTQATSGATAYVIRTPAADLATLRGSMPIGLRHELYEHPAAPVIRTVLTIMDRPQSALKLESFINVAEEDR